MKLVKSALLLGGLCLTTQVFADVTVDLPKGLDIVAVNGRNAKISKEATLPDGLNQLAVKFTGEFGSSKNNTDLVSSDVFVVRFEASNKNLRVQIPAMRNERNVKAFNKTADIRFIDNNDREITTKVARLEKDGFVFLRDYEQELKVFNRSDSPAAVSFYEDSTHSAVSVQGKGTTPIQVKKKLRPAPMVRDDASMAGKMLQYWFDQADEQTRRRFLDSVRDQ